MGTIGGGEVLVLFLVALIVLGPQKLPEAARQIARVAGELKRISNGFQRELREAISEPVDEFRSEIRSPLEQISDDAFAASLAAQNRPVPSAASQSGPAPSRPAQGKSASSAASQGGPAPSRPAQGKSASSADPQPEPPSDHPWPRDPEDAGEPRI